MSFRQETNDRLAILERRGRIEIKKQIPGLTWGRDGSPCYESRYHDAAAILKLLIDDLGYEIADDGVVVRRVDGTED